MENFPGKIAPQRKINSYYEALKISGGMREMNFRKQMNSQTVNINDLAQSMNKEHQPERHARILRNLTLE